MKPPFLLPILLCLIVGSADAIAQTERSVSYEFKQCDEDVILLRVDPQRAERAVGPEFTLHLVEGKAVVAIMVQDCSQYWIDGRDLGANQHVHILVRIEGPADVRSVVGAQRTDTTMTWLNLFAGSTNPRGRAARMASGTAPEPIESAALDPLGWPRGGRVELGPDQRFAWNVPTANPSLLLLGVNHDIYVRGPAGDTLMKRIQAIARLVAEPSMGTLEVQGAAELGDLIGAGRYSALVYTLFPIWARGNLGESVTR